MQENSFKRLTIDWTRLRTDVVAAAAGAQTVPDAYPAIRLALQFLADDHSHYAPPGGQQVIIVRSRTCGPRGDIARPSLPASIGYVRITAFSGSAAQATAFADEIQAQIVSADRDGMAGWIVDLRGNAGGNMWPMIAGVGPVLGEGIFGYSIEPNGAALPWEYRDGTSFHNGIVQHRMTTTYRLRREHPRVAVLTDGGVVSSGEATAIAFRQRSNTRSFGAPTCGASTVVRGFPLGDGASLNLAVAVMADRARTPYGDVIPPDETTQDPVERAVAWLLGS